MSRPASDATLLRHAKTTINDLNKELANCQAARDSYRARATKAEQEVAEWKLRFDLLLKREGPSND